MDKLAVALIRSLNSQVISIKATDQDVYNMFGQAAQPLADGIREAIREEIARINAETV
jgi:hypothetical protein